MLPAPKEHQDDRQGPFLDTTTVAHWRPVGLVSLCRGARRRQVAHRWG